MHRITDPDVQILAALSGTIAQDYAGDGEDPWELSPFKWILGTTSRRRGAIGESLVAGWCAAKGFDVTRSPNSDADRVIAGQRIEIKFSTLWSSGVFKFQQIRDQEYDAVFCLGLAPFDAHAWLLPKSVLRTYVIGHMGQHTGAGGADTSWLSFRPETPYPWMAPYGGTLEDVFRVLASLTGAGR